MNAVSNSNPAGEKIAEAVLAAALALPLVFAFAVLNSSGWFRGAASPRAAESSPSLHSARQPKLTLASSPPILARRNGHGLSGVNNSGVEVAKRQTPNKQEAVMGIDPVPGDGGKAGGADLDEAAARQVIGDGVRKRGQSE